MEGAVLNEGLKEVKKMGWKGGSWVIDGDLKLKATIRSHYPDDKVFNCTHLIQTIFKTRKAMRLGNGECSQCCSRDSKGTSAHMIPDSEEKWNKHAKKMKLQV